MKVSSKINVFLAYVRSQHGKDWHVRAIYSDAAGWQIEWAVGDRSLVLLPVQARRLVRHMRNTYRIAFRRMKPEQRALADPEKLFAWLDAYDRKAKLALHWARKGIAPNQVAA